MEDVQLIVFALCVIALVILFITWLVKVSSYLKGTIFDKNNYLGLFSVPFTIVIDSLLLFLFLILDINKFNLLYLFPIIHFCSSFFGGYLLADLVLKKKYEKVLGYKEYQDLYKRGGFEEKDIN